MTKRAGSSISYASYNLPTLINSGSNSSALYYGAFRNRYKQVAVSSGASETTIYVADGLFEKVTRPGGVIEYRHYLPGGQGIAALHTRRSAGGNSTYYWHADHLGSPEAFTDSGATVLVRPSFGAFGERRDGSDWNGPPSAADLTAIGNITRRGFTGHEHLDSVGLIHMNGRVYDPAMGRFLSADPILGVGISQDVNSYNYAWNSPLNVTDPSGLTEDVPRRSQCIEPPCGTATPLPAVYVWGDLFDPWHDAAFSDQVSLASLGSGIELAINLGDGIERQFAGPDGDIIVSATRLGATFGASGTVAGTTQTEQDDVDICSSDVVPLIIVALNLGGGPISGEVGDIFVVDWRAGEIHAYSYGGIGLGLSGPTPVTGAVSFEIGAISGLDSRNEVTGFGWGASGFAAVGPRGVAGQYSSNFSMAYHGATGGYAAGLGASIGVVGTYTRFDRTFSLGNAPQPIRNLVTGCTKKR